MALTEAQKLAREGKLTASRVACLMTGDKAKILQLWRELCGDPTASEENLDDVWAVQLGSCTEKLNLDWYERTSQRTLVQRGSVVNHPDYSWAAATLDGFDPVLHAPVEAKHVSGFEKFDAVLQRYMPQCHWQMECTQAKRCVFSVIQGGRQPTIEMIDYDKAYADELMARALRFMEHVWNYTEPVVLDPVAYTKISAGKEYNFTGNNQWATHAMDWLSNKQGAEKFEDAEKKLRELIPNDAKSCIGYGVEAKRNRALRVSIKATEDEKAKKKINHK